jgi:hypothetical protein
VRVKDPPSPAASDSSSELSDYASNVSEGEEEYRRNMITIEQDVIQEVVETQVADATFPATVIAEETTIQQTTTVEDVAPVPIAITEPTTAAPVFSPQPIAEVEESIAPTQAIFEDEDDNKDEDPMFAPLSPSTTEAFPTRAERSRSPSPQRLASSAPTTSSSRKTTPWPNAARKISIDDNYGDDEDDEEL